MKKIDYAIQNKPKYWSYMNKDDILDNLCPYDFGLKNIEECQYAKMYFQPCEKCWNKEILK